MWETILDYFDFDNIIPVNKDKNIKNNIKDNNIKDVNIKNIKINTKNIKEEKNKYQLCWNNSKIFEFGEIIN